MEERELIPHLFKTEYRKIVSVLCKWLGIVHIALAEDITNDTFLLATETWGLKGIPENPVAWLYTVAKNKTRDHLRRSKRFDEKIAPQLLQESAESTGLPDFSDSNIHDSQLQMMFAVCHPSIPAEAQIGLALRILCGFGIDEIAGAFLTNKETVNKRLHRAKEKLRAENIRIEFPGEAETDRRLENVLATLYLLFNEGYYSRSSDQKIRRELCAEAMRLTSLLLENPGTAQPKTDALLSLMCFQASRFEARTDAGGETVLYEEQDRSLWNAELIARGNQYLIRSARGTEISKYHLEASIAYWHCTPVDPPDKWEKILQLYNKRLQLEYSPAAALNRTYALARADGKAAALREIEKINLPENPLYQTLLGYLYTDGDNEKALSHYRLAVSLSTHPADKKIIERYILKLTQP